MFKSIYAKQAQLLLRCLPEVGKQTCFALKGGTAINFFFRPMPRLSVDIDLAYLPLGGRDKALADISRALEDIATDVRQRVGSTHVQISRAGGMATKLVVALDDAQIKVEPNHVLRGSVYPPEVCDLCPEAQSFFELFVAVPTLSHADLYAGKICAATGNIRATCSMCGFCWTMSFTSRYAGPLSFIWPVRSPHARVADSAVQKDFAETYATEFAGMARDSSALFERDTPDIWPDSQRQMRREAIPAHHRAGRTRLDVLKYLIARRRPCSGNCKTSGGWFGQARQDAGEIAPDFGALTGVARLAGIEPATLGLEIPCSVQLSYRRIAENIL